MKKIIGLLLSIIPVSLPSQAVAMAEKQNIASAPQGNVVIIRQSGGGKNMVKINQSGDDNVAEVFQEGQDNAADISQSGAENHLSATQMGDKNTLKRSQTGKSFTTINQNGEITTYSDDGEVVKVH